MKILIGTPIKETLPVGYVQSLVNMITADKDNEFTLQLEYGALYDARDRICRRVIRDDFDCVLFIDSDMTFEPDLAKKLTSHGLDVVTGLYVDKHENHKPLIFDTVSPEDEDNAPFATRAGLRFDEPLIEIQGCGAGALMITNNMLRLVQIHQHDWFKPFKGLGEDVSFCHRVTSAPLNHKIYCDTTARLGHLKTIEFTFHDWTGVLDEVKGG